MRKRVQRQCVEADCRAVAVCTVHRRPVASCTHPVCHLAHFVRSGHHSEGGHKYPQCLGVAMVSCLVAGGGPMQCARASAQVVVPLCGPRRREASGHAFLDFWDLHPDLAAHRFARFGSILPGASSHRPYCREQSTVEWFQSHPCRSRVRGYTACGMLIPAAHRLCNKSHWAEGGCVREADGGRSGHGAPGPRRSAIEDSC